MIPWDFSASCQVLHRAGATAVKNRFDEGSIAPTGESACEHPPPLSLPVGDVGVLLGVPRGVVGHVLV